MFNIKPPCFPPHHLVGAPLSVVLSFSFNLLSFAAPVFPRLDTFLEKGYFLRGRLHPSEAELNILFDVHQPPWRLHLSRPIQSNLCHSRTGWVQVGASSRSCSRIKTMGIVIAPQIPSAYLRERENEWQSKEERRNRKGEWQRGDCNCYLRERWWVSFGRWEWCKMLLNHFPLETSAKIFNFLFKFSFPPPSSYCAHSSRLFNTLEQHKLDPFL